MTKNATLIIHTKCDQVTRFIAAKFGVPVQDFIYTQIFKICYKIEGSICNFIVKHIHLNEVVTCVDEVYLFDQNKKNNFWKWIQLPQKLYLRVH